MPAGSKLLIMGCVKKVYILLLILFRDSLGIIGLFCVTSLCRDLFLFVCVSGWFIVGKVSTCGL